MSFASITRLSLLVILLSSSVIFAIIKFFISILVSLSKEMLKLNANPFCWTKASYAFWTNPVLYRSLGTFWPEDLTEDLLASAFFCRRKTVPSKR
ncbi:uncharacterized protein BX663DRAFT_493924 [Cokeromyces recurvatus]|uniref:uncharacterized protein n=1 Tax=Cokeromyces recurvatus TaxID=90255 RepID=UPI0022202675|nr:uncharacterized protein BX663DRAFT_493924 [Cokeromyces recurvatus]KAI7906828.1 hypothetical protein BX663DRAFT_493924 [Cokeromyces recurvatus]